MLSRSDQEISDLSMSMKAGNESMAYMGRDKGT